MNVYQVDFEAGDGCMATTKTVRGFLCAPCNLGLGHFRDRPDLLCSAIQYLNVHQSTDQETEDAHP